MKNDKVYENLRKVFLQMESMPRVSLNMKEVVEPLRETFASIERAIKPIVIQQETISKMVTSYSDAINSALKPNQELFRDIARIATLQHNQMAQLQKSLNVDYEKIIKTVIQATEILPENSTVEDLIQKTAETYEIETPEEEELFTPLADENTEEETKSKKGQHPQIIQYIELVIAILSLFVGVLSVVQAEKQPVINEYYIQNITNVYIEEGYDTVLLDLAGYRIVDRRTVVYQKTHPTKGTAGELGKGSIARILRRYKKWVEIEWQDDKGYHSGWIQNYKLKRFA